MRCLVLAGGLGTRLGSRTEHVPKCLIEVAGRPFAHLQLEWLADQGVRQVVFSIGHHGDMVRAALGDGSPWGVHIDYVDEGEDLRGTGGAVRLAVERGVVESAFFVLYGDSYLCADLRAVEAVYAEGDHEALMTVYRNAGRFERSNAVFAGGLVTRYEKGLAHPPPEMDYVDYGLSVLRPDTVAAGVSPDVSVDLAELLHDLSVARRLAGFEATERFYEIGSPEGLADLESHLAATGGPRR
jgi:NDP-sugar pyrophosphorylase family protein